MTKVMRKAYTEVNEILKYMPEEYVNKIPLKFRKMFEDCRLKDYEVNINPDKSINEQKLVYETLVILTILKYNFWCESDEERKLIQTKLRENDQKSQDMYDFSKLNAKEDVKNFEKSIENEKKEIASNLPVKVEKKSWFSNILFKIKNMLKK